MKAPKNLSVMINKRWVRILVVMLSVISLVLAYPKPLDAAQITVNPKIGAQNLNRVVADLPIGMRELVRCESLGNPRIVVLDTNNQYSFGLFQFQEATFRKYGERYGLISNDLSRKQLLSLILNPYLQIKIATRMLEDGLWFNWYNCAKKIGVNKLSLNQIADK